jgi:putative peptidoglycan lipid II flippase
VLSRTVHPADRIEIIDVTASDESNPQPRTQQPRRNPLGFLRPSASHSAFSATILLMLSTFLSGVLGLVRTKYINYIFGAGPETDAYNAAFQLPDMLAYFLVGGVASISLVTILNRYRAQGDDEGGDRALSIVLNAMIVVLGLGILVAELLAPLYTRIAFRGFGPEQAALCTSLTRILLPAQLFFFIGGVIGSRLLVRRIFLYQAITPLIYNLGIILGAVLLHQRFGIYSLAIGVLAGVIFGPAALTAFGAFRDGLRYHPILQLNHPAFREWLRLTLPLMIGVSLVTADKWILSYFASNDTGGITRLMVAKTLFTAPMGILGQAAGAASLPFFSALFSQNRRDEFATAVNRAVSRVLAASLLLGSLDDRPLDPDRRSLPRRLLHSLRCPRHRDLLHRLRALHRLLGRAGDLCPRLLRRRQYRHPGHRGVGDYAVLHPDLQHPVPRHRSHRPCHRVRHRHRHPDPHARHSPAPPRPRPPLRA